MGTVRDGARFDAGRWRRDPDEILTSRPEHSNAHAATDDMLGLGNESVQVRKALQRQKVVADHADDLVVFDDRGMTDAEILE